jgi:hypothetical protein
MAPNPHGAALSLHRFGLALVLQWRQDYPNKRPPTRATAISAMGHLLPPAPQKAQAV